MKRISKANSLKNNRNKSIKANKNEEIIVLPKSNISRKSILINNYNIKIIIPSSFIFKKLKKRSKLTNSNTDRSDFIKFNKRIKRYNQRFIVFKKNNISNLNIISRNNKAMPSYSCIINNISKYNQSEYLYRAIVIDKENFKVVNVQIINAINIKYDKSCNIYFIALGSLSKNNNDIILCTNNFSTYILKLLINLHTINDKCIANNCLTIISNKFKLYEINKNNCYGLIKNNFSIRNEKFELFVNRDYSILKNYIYKDINALISNLPDLYSIPLELSVNINIKNLPSIELSNVNSIYNISSEPNLKSINNINSNSTTCYNNNLQEKIIISTVNLHDNELNVAEKYSNIETKLINNLHINKPSYVPGNLVYNSLNYNMLDSCIEIKSSLLYCTSGSLVFGYQNHNSSLNNTSISDDFNYILGLVDNNTSCKYIKHKNILKQTIKNNTSLNKDVYNNFRLINNDKKYIKFVSFNDPVLLFILHNFLKIQNTNFLSN